MKATLSRWPVGWREVVTLKGIQYDQSEQSVKQLATSTQKFDYLKCMQVLTDRNRMAYRVQFGGSESLCSG